MEVENKNAKIINHTSKLSLFEERKEKKKQTNTKVIVLKMNKKTNGVQQGEFVFLHLSFVYHKHHENMQETKCIPPSSLLVVQGFRF